MQPVYIAVTQRIREKQCQEVGLIIPGGFWEYSFWVLLQDQTTGPVHIEAFDVANETTRLQSQEFEPCALICIQCSETSETKHIEEFGIPELRTGSNLLFVK